MTQFIAARGLSIRTCKHWRHALSVKKPYLSLYGKPLETQDGDFLDLAWSEEWHAEQAQKKPVLFCFTV